MSDSSTALPGNGSPSAFRTTSVLSRGLVYLADAELAAGDRRAARAALSRAREVVENEPVSAFAVTLLDEAETRIGRGTARAAARSGVMVEELTDRELSILRALQGTASQREIGSALFLSINTVKAYTKSLYRKLGVVCRQDAVAAARNLGLIRRATRTRSPVPGARPAGRLRRHPSGRS